MIILADMDNTLVDLLSPWLEQYFIMGGEHLFPSDIKSYNCAQ